MRKFDDLNHLIQNQIFLGISSIEEENLVKTNGRIVFASIGAKTINLLADKVRSC